MTRNIKITEIHLPVRQQARREFAAAEIASLAASIAAQGLLMPIIVRPRPDGGYELVAGERRLRATSSLGHLKITATVLPLTDAESVEVGLIENLQRQDLNAIEETHGLLTLFHMVLGLEAKGLTSLLNRAANSTRRGVAISPEDTANLAVVDDLLRRVGRLSREGFRTNRLPLLNMPADAIAELHKGMDYTKVQAVAKVQDPEVRETLFAQVRDQRLSVSALKQQVAATRKTPAEQLSSDLLAALHNLGLDFQEQAAKQYYSSYKVMRPDGELWLTVAITKTAQLSCTQCQFGIGAGLTVVTALITAN